MRNPQLLGRDGELAALDDLLGRLPGAGGSTTLTGEPGIGRTALLRAATARARVLGARILRAAGAPAMPPYAGLRALLGPLLGALSGPLPDSLPGPILGPASGSLPGPLPGPLPGRADALPESQRALPLVSGGAVLRLLTESAEKRPLLLAVDDAHLLDRPSWEVLGFVARRLGHDPVVLVATARGESGAPPGREFGAPAGWESCAPAGRALEVRPLDDVTSRVLLDRHAPGLRVTARERILEVACGNPLALVELPVAWRDGGPSDSWTSPRVTPRLAGAFAGGLAGLAAPARDALLVAAADHVGDLPEILAAAAILAGGEVTVDLLDTAVTTGLVHLDGMRLRFRHPVVRAAVLAAEPPARVHAAHEALATVLATEPHHEPHRRAWHHAHTLTSTIGARTEPTTGVSDPRADPATDVTGARADSGTDVTDARAESVAGVADALADVRAAAVNRRGVAPAVWALELAARLSPDRSTRTRRLLAAARFAYGLGRAHVVHDLLDAATGAGLGVAGQTRVEWLRDVCDEDTKSDPARVTRLCAIAKRAAGTDPDVALDLLHGAALRIQRTAPGAAAQAIVAATADALAAAIPASTADPRHIAALALAEPVLRNQAVAERLPATAAVADLPDAEGLRLLGVAAHAIGDPVKAVALLGRAESTLRDQGRAGPLAQSLILRMTDLYLLGEWERAARVAEEASRVLAGTRQPGWADAFTAARAVAAGLRGDTEGALKLAARADGTRRFDLVAGVRLARGLGWLAARRHDRAHEELWPLFAKPLSGLGRESFAAVIPYVAAALGVERLGEARSVLAKLEDVARITAAPLLLVQLPYARAVLAGDGEAGELYRAALGADLARWPLVEAATGLAYASWLRRRRRFAEARTAQDAARGTLRLLGAPLWADLERGGTGAGGGRCHPEDVLSPRELRIAELAAAGLSNREIAAQIHLSARTVGSYLSGLFPKLGVTARGQLAARLRSAAAGAVAPRPPW